MPFRMEGGRAFGPGVFDMKAGIAVAMAAMASLAQVPGTRATLLLLPDEEVGTSASRGLLLSTARRHARVLVLEPSLDGAAKVARKGVGAFEIRLHGRAAHAGLEPEKGASALSELARCNAFLEGLADPARGTTVTPTVARAGTATNVVPETATLSVDARAWSTDEGGRVEHAIRSYRPRDDRVACHITGGFDRPPLEPTAASTALFERARAIAVGLGFDLGAARVGGASDGNLTAAAGLPTLDGLGPKGGGAHARDEFVVIDDLPVRAELIRRLVLALG
jgi:glutamate carboxypeptidase